MKSELLPLIEENQNIIYSIINKYKHYYDCDDLYQVAIVGLINAYRNYQYDKNTKFSSYAYFYILGEVKKYIRESIGIKVSRDIQKLNLMIEKATIILSQKLLRYPTDKELSLFLEVSEEEIIASRQSKIFIDSLDKENDEELSLYSIIGYEEKLYDAAILDLRNELDNLSDFDKKLIEQRYFEEKSQSETAISLGINQVKVSRREKEILTRLRTKL